MSLPRVQYEGMKKVEAPPASLFCGWAILGPLLPGAAHSLALLTIGHPFDTVKTRMQLGMSKTALGGIYDIFKRQGFWGLYRGAPMPFLQLIVKRPFEFAVFESFNSRFRGETYAPALGGLLAGVTSSIIGCPFSVVKIQMQSTGKDVHSNFFEAVNAVWKTRGATGFYRGFVATIYKELPFATLFLGTYGNLREALPASPWAHALAGASASGFVWTVLLPLDTLKTIIQAGVLKDTEARGWITQFRHFVQTRGVIGLWAGWGPVALRSFPSSATAMVAYEWTRSATAQW